MEKVIRVATRGSSLAFAQTSQLVADLQESNPGVSFEIITFKTTGDRVTDRPLVSFRGTGVFVKELQNALITGKADIAVHSLKDIPVDEPDELMLASFPVREDYSDLLLTRNQERLSELKPGAIVGTGSPRRIVQLKALRPDLQFSDLRGNLDTRLRKLEEGHYDAIVVAAAGMNRLKKRFDPQSRLQSNSFLPAVGQGILAIECRRDDREILIAVSRVNDESTALAANIEREFLSGVGGGCSFPIAALAQVGDSEIKLEGMIGDPESGKLIRDSQSQNRNSVGEIGSILALRMKDACDKAGIRIKLI